MISSIAGILEIPILSHFTYSELKEQFDNLGPIGGGGEATIFKVRSTKNNEVYALRLNHEMQRINLNKREGFFQQITQSQNKNPHLAKIMAVFWLENKNYPFYGAKKKGVVPFMDIPTGEFIRTDYSTDSEAISYYHEIIVLELGDQDAEITMKVDSIIFTIQSFFNSYCLHQMGIISSDDKSRNYVWMRTEDESYNGKLLKNFNYWFYSFGNNIDFYIPQQDYIPKRVDFGVWEIKNVEQEINWSAALAWHLSTDVNALQKLFPKPDVHENEILDMGSLLKV